MSRWHAPRSGYIIVSTLMVTALAMTIITLIALRGSLFAPYARTAVAREQARQLALGGLACAMGQLLKTPDVHLEQQDKKQPSPEVQEGLLLLRTLLPTINRWQQVALQKKRDGVDGVISLCIMCEEGKVNLNAIYDTNKQKFAGEGQKTGDWKVIMQKLFQAVEKKMKGKGLFDAFVRFMKERKQPLRDVTELLAIPEFSIFREALFYEPPEMGEAGERPLYLTDLFTVSSVHRMFEPWLFSDSIAGAYELKRVQTGDSVERAKMLDKLLNGFTLQANWKRDWNERLKPLYAKELQSLLKELESVLNSRFDPQALSVLVHGTVDGVMQRLWAIVRRTKEFENGRRQYGVEIMRLYWL